MARLALCPRLLLPALLPLIAASQSDTKMPSCDPKRLNDCGKNQICKPANNTMRYQCECIEGYFYNSSTNECTETRYDPPAESSPATAAIVTIFTLALMICALVLVVRRYNLIDWLRQKIQRRDNSVMYEDVMIGQDDPPIAA